MSGDIVRRLRLEAPYVEVGELMLRAADALDAVSGSGVPAFLSVVGVPGGVVEVPDRVRAVLLAQGWMAPGTLDAALDAAWQEGFDMAAKGNAA